MGRTSDEEGETSTKTCKSDDIDDRPLKKARYVWQIKGKYHLKKPDDDKSSLFVSKSNLNDDCATLAVSHCSQIECKNSSCNCEFKVIESRGDCVKDIDGKLYDEHRILPNIKDGAQLEPDSTPGIVTQSEKREPVHSIPTTTTRSLVTKRPASTAKVLRCGRVSSSWQLRKWQARQVARCFVDNTINRVLEDMGFVPLPVDADDILDEEFPMTESENDESLEDEAVLMAIHSHGLQRTEGLGTGSGADNIVTNDVKKLDLPQINSCSKERGIPVATCACSVAQRVSSTDVIDSLDPFHQRPVMWHRLEFDTERCHDVEGMSNQSLDELKRNGNLMSRWCGDGGIFGSILTSDSSCDSDIKSYEENVKDSAKQEFLNKEPDVAILPIPEIQEIIPNPKGVAPKLEVLPGDIPLEDKVEEKSSSSFEHKDFLDKAVAVAIQKKGLSTLSCIDYG